MAISRKTSAIAYAYMHAYSYYPLMLSRSAPHTHMLPLNCPPAWGRQPVRPAPKSVRRNLITKSAIWVNLNRPTT